MRETGGSILKGHAWPKVVLDLLTDRHDSYPSRLPGVLSAGLCRVLEAVLPMLWTLLLLGSKHTLLHLLILFLFS